MRYWCKTYASKKGGYSRVILSSVNDWHFSGHHRIRPDGRRRPMSIHQHTSCTQINCPFWNAASVEQTGVPASMVDMQEGLMRSLFGLLKRARIILTFGVNGSSHSQILTFSNSDTKMCLNLISVYNLFLDRWPRRLVFKNTTFPHGCLQVRISDDS